MVVKKYRIILGGWQSVNESFWKDIWTQEENETKKENHMIRTYPRTRIGDYFTIAAGDFFAIRANRFELIKGIPEKEWYGGTDSLVMMIASLEGEMCQVVLNAPYAICHQDHTRSQTVELPGFDFQLWNDVLAGKNPQTNDENWGLVNFNIPEYELIDGKWIN